MEMDRRYMVKNYVAVIRSRTGQRFMVFKTGDKKWYLFCPLVGESSVMGDIQFPIERKRLRREIASMLNRGCGNSI